MKSFALPMALLASVGLAGAQVSVSQCAVSLKLSQYNFFIC